MAHQEARPTPTVEDYLGILYVLDRDGEPAVAARLAEMLEVSAPTVANTLKRMARDGWIETEDRKEIHLTPEGYAAARSLIRRHMLTEWMLARMLQVPWSQIHSEAHQIEHSISDEIENRLRENLEDPQLCPHGNPLPGYEYVAQDWVALTNILAGEKVIIRRIHEIVEDRPEILNFLEASGVLPGQRATVREALPFNETLTLEMAEKQVVLGLALARYVFVERETE